MRQLRVSARPGSLAAGGSRGCTIKRQPFRHEPGYQDATLIDLIHHEAMNREVTRLWPTLRKADNGTWTAPMAMKTRSRGLRVS